jgi:hypothetical protein
VAKFGDDGRSVVLEDGRVIPATAVILATGYESTWRSIFDGECQCGINTVMRRADCSCIEVTMEQLGLGRHPPGPRMKYRWDYASLANPPVIPGKTPWAASIYRGLVPAKNILNRDFAVNGATVLCLFWEYRYQLSPLHNLTNSLLPIPHMCARCPPIGFLHISNVMPSGFLTVLGRLSTLPSMMELGCDDVTLTP